MMCITPPLLQSRSDWGEWSDPPEFQSLEAARFRLPPRPDLRGTDSASSRTFSRNNLSLSLTSYSRRVSGRSPETLLEYEVRESDRLLREKVREEAESVPRKSGRGGKRKRAASSD